MVCYSTMRLELDQGFNAEPVYPSSYYEYDDNDQEKHSIIEITKNESELGFSAAKSQILQNSVLGQSVEDDSLSRRRRSRPTGRVSPLPRTADPPLANLDLSPIKALTSSASPPPVRPRPRKADRHRGSSNWQDVRKADELFAQMENQRRESMPDNQPPLPRSESLVSLTRMERDSLKKITRLSPKLEFEASFPEVRSSSNSTASGSSHRSGTTRPLKWNQAMLKCCDEISNHLELYHQQQHQQKQEEMRQPTKKEAARPPPSRPLDAPRSRELARPPVAHLSESCQYNFKIFDLTRDRSLGLECSSPIEYARREFRDTLTPPCAPTPPLLTHGGEASRVLDLAIHEASRSKNDTLGVENTENRGYKSTQNSFVSRPPAQPIQPPSRGRSRVRQTAEMAAASTMTDREEPRRTVAVSAHRDPAPCPVRTRSRSTDQRPSVSSSAGQSEATLSSSINLPQSIRDRFRAPLIDVDSISSRSGVRDAHLRNLASNGVWETLHGRRPVAVPIRRHSVATTANSANRRRDGSAPSRPLHPVPPPFCSAVNGNGSGLSHAICASEQQLMSLVNQRFPHWRTFTKTLLEDASVGENVAFSFREEMEERRRVRRRLQRNLSEEHAEWDRSDNIILEKLNSSLSAHGRYSRICQLRILHKALQGAR